MLNLVATDRDVVLESRTSFFGLGLGLETCELGFELGFDTSGLETWT